MKKHGHYCKVCGEYKANEKFPAKVNAAHICKSCASLSPEKQAEQMTVNQLTESPLAVIKGADFLAEKPNERISA